MVLELKGLKKELENMKNDEVLVIVCKSELYKKINNIVVKYLTNKLKLNGIYISLNSSSKMIETNFKKEKISTNRIFFIDSSGEKTKKENYAQISNPSSLVELSVLLNKLTNTGEFQFVFLDSVSTLTLYNELGTVTKFSHYLMTKLKTLGLRGVIITLKEEKSDKVLPFLIQLADKVLHY